MPSACRSDRSHSVFFHFLYHSCIVSFFPLLVQLLRAGHKQYQSKYHAHNHIITFFLFRPRLFFGHHSRTDMFAAPLFLFRRGLFYIMKRLHRGNFSRQCRRLFAANENSNQGKHDGYQKDYRVRSSNHTHIIR